jgi:hypothetical protein
VKLVFVDTKSVNQIGEQHFYVLPAFDRVVLSKIYAEMPSGSCDAAVPYLKVKRTSDGHELIARSDQLVWSQQPYELPC